ncbi:MAG TPA: DUF763 domain-containing protein [Deltaproteobacteria bacterium]|nr:DUF763 domain-containing protein [Deltaproteobacteria bacterium]
MRTGIMTSPLHAGKAPRWLFRRMALLSREVVKAIVMGFGTEELLLRVSDPLWFQALGCVLGFDWHSSGVTTTVCGALKEGIAGMEQELGLFICGGKGGRSRMTPSEIESFCDEIGLDPRGLVRSSRLSAKVDNNALQDGYQLYHHTFFFDISGKWSVVQQGMDTLSRTARRYHWTGIRLKAFVDEPHTGICSDVRQASVLDLTSKDSRSARHASVEVLRQGPDFVLSELRRYREHTMPSRHSLMLKDINPDNIRRVLIQTYEQDPGDFTGLLEARGAGPKTIRALAMLAEIIYGTKVSRKDPAVFSFAHGGKDGTPYPVDRKTYDSSIDILKHAVDKARMGDKDKLAAIKRLTTYYG